MEDTYIQNKGITKTFIHHQGENSVNEIGWNANYDGSIANVAMGINNNGQISNYHFQLDNNDLEEMLSVPSVNQTLDQRLMRDFSNSKKKRPLFIIVEDPQTKIKLAEPLFNYKPKPKHKTKCNCKTNTPHSAKTKKIHTHISSPRTIEEFIVPMKKLTASNNSKQKSRRRSSYTVYKIPKRYSRRTI
jgi:hypothetical protein